MNELNHTASVEVFDEDGCDPLTVVDMGEMIALSQVAEDGVMHDVSIGLRQAERLHIFIGNILRNAQ